MRRFEMHMPEELFAALEARAHKAGVPSASMAKVVLADWLENRTAERPPAEHRAEAA